MPGTAALSGKTMITLCPKIKIGYLVFWLILSVGITNISRLKQETKLTESTVSQDAIINPGKTFFFSNTGNITRFA